MVIEEVTFKTHLPEAQYQFYTQQLGLPGTCDERGRIQVLAGSTLLQFEPVQSPAYYHYAFNIPPNLYKPALNWLEGKVTVLPDEQGRLLVDFSNWNAYAMYFFDPAGNIVELIARRDLPEYDAKTFRPELIWSVSEVGLPVPNVAVASGKLEKIAGLPFYSGNQETFNAVGNPEGLFIVVDEAEKTWYPTSKPAHRFPVRGRFKQNDQAFLFQLSPDGLEVRPASGRPQ